MLDAWLLEGLKSIGRFFVHPLFYYGILLAFLIGYLRVKRERRFFHIRVYDVTYEIRSFLTKGLTLGLILSVFTIGAGVVLPFGTLALIACITILLSLPLRLRWLSPAYTIGISLFAAVILAKEKVKIPFISEGLENINLSALAVLLAALIIIEGILIVKNGRMNSSPTVERSKRGLPIGAHIAQRLWLVPVFLLVPGESIASRFEWWPVFQVGGDTYALWLVPFLVGFHQRVRGSHPSEAIRITGRQVVLHGSVIMLFAIGSIWLPILAFVAALFAMVGREIISLHHRLRDEDKPFYFSKKKQGLIVLGIIPLSPAERMALEIGETITKVNNIQVNSVSEFYEALQKNRALCKLEVIGLNGEVRLVQKALYDGEHHELGILFVPEGKKWETEAV
jgi:hypothetical protein